MAEQTTTDIHTDAHIEKVTAPDRKSDQLDDQAIDEEQIVLEALLNKEDGRLQAMFPRDKPGLRAYGAALAGGFAIVPIFLLAFTVAIYLVMSGVPNWVPVLAGLVVTFLLWLLISTAMIPLAARDKANSRSYGMLVSRLSQLETRLQIIQASHQKFSLYQRIALEEAYGNFQELDAMLYDSTSRLPWVLGIGYVVAWFKLHRAEEALMDVEPVEMVVREAYHDHLAISNSKMSNANDLLDRLHIAVKTLDPGMADAVSSATPLADVAAHLKDIAGDLKEVKGKLQKPTKETAEEDHQQDDQAHKDDHDHAPGTPGKEDNARVTIREIRRTLNEYRDQLWDNIIRGRNRLMGGIFITGFATYVLLCVALLASTSPGNGIRPAILAATAYYIVGAVAGLFGTIYRESNANASDSSDSDDYGLTLARLIATPLLSGLAGLAGAFLYSIIILQVAQITASTASLSSIFSLNRIDYLIAAALAGYAPSIIVQGLQQRTNKYLSALQSSKASDGANSDD